MKLLAFFIFSTLHTYQVMAQDLDTDHAQVQDQPQRMQLHDQAPVEETSPRALASEDSQTQISLRLKSSRQEVVATIEKLATHNEMIALTQSQLVKVGDVLAIESQSSEIKILGFAEVIQIDKASANFLRLKARLIRTSRFHFVIPGDRLVALDLKTEDNRYMGYTDLLIRNKTSEISSKYRPLFTQGILIGNTAHTLTQGEYIFSIYGQLNYGLFDRLTLGTLVTGLLLNAPNMSAKAKVFETYSDTVSLGLNATKLPTAPTTAVNVNLMWDSVTNDRLISHTLISLAVIAFEKAEDTVAVKESGTSSFQSGYELILTNWDRVLFGPVYNFETRTLGGYVGYNFIWDQFHFQTTLSAVNIRELKLDPKTGYVAGVEAYWRF